MKELINKQIQENIDASQKLLNEDLLKYSIERATHLCLSSLTNNGKLMLLGNGGSAADCQHLAAEFVTRLNFDRPSLCAIALTTDTSVMTAISNDYDYDQVFARQLKTIGSDGDTLIAISTSGNSNNVITAAKLANEMKINVIGLTGEKISKLHDHSDVILNVPSSDTARIQEMHILIGHIICTLVEKELFEDLRPLKK